MKKFLGGGLKVASSITTVETDPPAELCGADSVCSFPVFPRQFTPSGTVTTIPGYHDQISGWSYGGTLYRSQLAATYDAAGAPVESEIKALAAQFDDCSSRGYLAFDIEELGFNDSPNCTRSQLHQDYVAIWRDCLPDAKLGFYGTFGDVLNNLRIPFDYIHGATTSGFYASTCPLWETNRKRCSYDLIAEVDFIAPVTYVTYEGPVRNLDGTAANGVPSWASRFPPGFSYGLAEWQIYFRWMLEMVNPLGKPVMPYVAPYTILNNADGTYGGGFQWVPTFFDDLVQTVYDEADGMFFFDLSSANRPASDEQFIVDSMQSVIDQGCNSPTHSKASVPSGVMPVCEGKFDILGPFDTNAVDETHLDLGITISDEFICFNDLVLRWSNGAEITIPEGSPGWQLISGQLFFLYPGAGIDNGSFANAPASWAVSGSLVGIPECVVCAE